MPWLDEHDPFDAPRSEAQIAGVLAAVGDAPRRVLDLGCGNGRVAIPIAAAGHAVMAVDRDGEAINALRARAAKSDAQINDETLDFCDPDALSSIAGPFDAILLLGNTLMTLTDTSQAAALFCELSGMLSDTGVILIDDIPGDFWPEVSDGYWQNGISDDGSMQMVWANDDSVFAIRNGDAVDESRRHLDDRDRCFRLWTMGALRLLAMSAGLSARTRDQTCGLITFRGRA